MKHYSHMRISIVVRSLVTVAFSLCSNFGVKLWMKFEKRIILWARAYTMKLNLISLSFGTVWKSVQCREWEEEKKSKSFCILNNTIIWTIISDITNTKGWVIYQLLPITNRVPFSDWPLNYLTAYIIIIRTADVEKHFLHAIY